MDRAIKAGDVSLGDAIQAVVTEAVLQPQSDILAWLEPKVVERRRDNADRIAQINVLSQKLRSKALADDERAAIVATLSRLSGLDKHR